MRRAAFPALALLAGCQMPPPAATPVVEAAPAAAERAPEGWRGIAKAGDAARIDRLAAGWETALASVGRSRVARLAAADPVLRPDGAAPRAAPPPGPYQCRLTRLGPGRGRRAITRYPVTFCHIGVHETRLSFAKQTGHERFDGYLYPDTDDRWIFLGANAARGEAMAPGYGADAARDLVGIVERVGAMRYRLVIPGADGAGLDIIELAPISAELR